MERAASWHSTYITEAFARAQLVSGVLSVNGDMHGHDFVMMGKIRGVSN
jgi:hypothetical protein